MRGCNKGLSSGLGKKVEIIRGALGFIYWGMEREVKIVIKDDPDHLAREAARIFTKTAVESSSRKGRFSVAVSGGSTPRRMHHMLTEEPFCSGIPWEKTYIFWVDERCVSEDHPCSNYGAAKKDLISRAPIPQSHLYPMPGEAPPEKGAHEYQNTLIRFFNLKQGKPPRFDLIFLGMGKDGHTASLFLEHAALEEKRSFVVSVKGGDPDMARLTMTFPVLNNARKIVFLISGLQKADILKTVLENNWVSLPAKRVQPLNGKLIWLVDREAASRLSKNTAHGKI